MQSGSFTSHHIPTAALSAGVLLPWQAVEGVGMQIRGRTPRNMPLTLMLEAL